MPFDIASARAAKKSDTEIADYLGGSLGFDVAAARKLGKTDTEIAEYLSTHERPAGIKPDAVMGNDGVAFKPVSLGDTFSGEQMAQQAALADPNSPDATNRSVLKDKGFAAASADARGDMPARKTEAKAKVNAAAAGFEKKDAAAKKGEGVAPRTATEGVNDLYVAGKQGLLNVNAGGSWLLDQIPGVDTGGFTASQLEESKRLNDDKSEYLKDANKAVEDADGFFDTMGTLIDNPAAIGDLIAQNASFVIPGMATGAAGAKIGGAMAARKAAQVGATEQAIAAAALAGRTTGAAVGGTAGESAISGGISGAQVEEQILGTEFSVLEQKSARYRELSTRMSPEQAREQLADEVSLATAAATGGATAVGGIMANKANKLLGLGDPYANALVQQVTAKTALKSTAGEVVQEMTQSPLEQIGGNLTNVDDSTAWDEDVTKSIALGAVGALGQSAGTQAIGMGVQSLKGEAPPANPAAGGIAPPVTDPISGATPDPISGAATTPEATVTASVVQAPASIPTEAELQADADALSARSQEKAALADEARAMGNLEMADQLEGESQTAAAAAKQALDTIEIEHTGLTGIANRTGIADAPAILPLSADEVGKGQLDAGNRAALGLDQLRDDEELQPVVAPAEPAAAPEQAPVAKAPSAQFDSAKPIADLTTADDMNLRKRAAYVRSSIRASGDEAFKAAAKAELKALTAEIDGRTTSSADPATVSPESVPAPVTAEASPIAGEAINAEWTAFAPDSGTLSIPRAEMPQIKAEHRGAMVNFLKARGITSDENVVKADSLKPTQAEFSPGKVEKAKSFTGGDRSILVSSDNHILDGHHQWLAKRDAGEDVKVIKLGAPIKSLLSEVAEFPSATTDDLGADDAPVIDTSPIIPADKRDGADLPPETMQQKAVRIARMRMEGQLNFTDLTARDAKGKALTAARQAGMTSDEIADIEAVAENTAESMAEFWAIGAQLLNEEVAKRNPEPPKGSKPAEIHYPNRKLGFERAKADPDDPHNTNAMANIALANLQPDDKVTVNGVTMTVKSIGSKAVTFTKPDGKITRFDIDTPRMEQLVRDVEGLIGASRHSTHGRDWVSVLSRDPTFGRSNGVISLRDGDTGATASVDDMNLTARRSRIGRALDQLSDNEVHAVYRRMGLAGEMLPVDEKRAALKQERPEDIEPALKIDQPAEQRTDTDRRQVDQAVANEQRHGARRVDAMTPEEMRQALLINPLTDLPNKRAFEEDADLGWPHVAAMDIDGFGFLNDIWGHDPVDAILKQIGGMMSEFSTDAVRLYHRSGDEFAARSNDKEALQLVLKSLQDHLEASTFTVDGIGEDGRPLKFIKHGIGVTFGISTDYQRADNEANADKERRLAAGKRGAKGSNPGGMVEVDAQGAQANLGSRGLSRQETERLRNRGSEGGLDQAQEASNRREDSRQKKSERMRALNAERARLNPADELLTAIAKLGGLSKADAEAQGIDPADFKQKRAGIMFVFKPAGKSFDAMAEALDAEGYPVQDDQGRYSANKLLDLVTDSLSGKPVYTSSGHEAVMAAEDIQRALEDGDVAALPPSEHIDGTQAESVAAVRLIDAVNAGYDWSIVGSMIGENDTEADMHRLFSGLIAGEQDYVDRYNAQAASAGAGQEDYSPAQQEQEDDIPGFSPEGQDQGDLTDAEMERHVFDRVPQDQIRAERQAESFSLEVQSEADLAAKEAREQDARTAREAEQRREIDSARDAFTLGTTPGYTGATTRPRTFTYKVKPSEGGFVIASDDGGGEVMAGRPNGPGILNTVPPRIFRSEADARAYMQQKGMTEAAAAETTRGERLQENLIAIDGELGMALGELASALRDLTPPGQLNTFVDPVVMGRVLAVGMKASVLYLQKGAVKFAIWANNMIVGLEGAGISPDIIKPYLSQLYLASKASVDKSIRSQMDGEDFVLDYDVETIGSKSEEVQAPSQAAEPAATATVKWFGTRAKADEHIEKKRLSSTHEVVQVGQRFEIHEKPKQGEANGSAELGEGSQGALAGVPAREGEAAAGQRSAGGGAARGSRADAQGNDRAGESGLQGARSLGNDTREVSVPEAGSAGGRAAGSAGAEPVRGSADVDESTVAVGGITAAVPATQLGADFAITDSDEVGVGGAKTKFKNNIAAIVLLKELERQGRPATRDEQSILAKYVGWGGIPQAFSRDGGAVTQGWERQATELREILTPDEYSAAAASTMNAHYTATEIVSGIWDAVQQFGFNGGAVLEPSVGTGNFFGKMPHGLRNASALVGVELDHITGGIAKLLYPAANIQSPMGFQDITVPDGHFDLAIGNPPFGSTQIHDGNNPAINRMSIHNYFFAKSVLGLKPNGVLAMVVTNRMMDAGADRARQFIADRTELLGAIRLPNDAFLKNAGTSVTTDIIFLRRLEEGEAATGESWTKVSDYSDKDGKTVPLNEYFHRNPDMMLGDFGAFGTMYREGDSALVAKPGQDTMKLMQEAIKKLPRDFMPTVQRAPTREVIAPVGDIDAIRVGSMFMQGDEIHVRMEDELGQQRSKPVVAGSAKSVERIKGMIAIRDALTTVRELQLSETSSEAAISKARAQLNKSYDAFVKANGPINQDTNKRAFRDDPTWPQISALEEGFEKGVSAAAAKATGLKQEGPSAKKAAIFTKRTQAPYRAPESAASAKDALVASLSELGRVDLAYMSKLYGKDESEIAAELSGMIYQNPVRGWETADEYLSGNVKQKLAIAEEAAKADPQFDKNVSALQDVQPADIEAVDISVKLGAHWVPVTDVAAFAKHITGDKTATAGYVSLLAKWTIDAKAASASIAAQWGTDRATIEEIITAAANQRTIQIKDKVSEDKYVVNEAATQAANEKVEALKNEWTRWLWSDDARRERLARQYNDTFNTDRQREYDGSHLAFPGKVGDDIIQLRPHQANAAWRIIQSASTLTDHVVGAGKTFTLIAAAMEMRRMGRASKPMFVVPNHLVGQWAADFVKLYPGANVLAASKKDFDKENRKRMFARIATGDWDAVIVAHSSFGKIGVHPDFVAKFIRDQIADIEVSITATREAEGKSSRNVKQIEKQKAALEEKLKDLFAQKKKDDSLYFDELGIDGLFLDEAHEFKNLQFSTSMSRIAGVPNSHSQKASDLFMKVQQVQQRTGGRNIVFATGTPISNSMAEMFTMQRYLDYKTMKDQGLAHFDAWARMYGEVVTDWELSPSGQYKMNSRFAKFVNMPELMQRYASFADVVNRDDINRMLEAQGKVLPVPKVRGGKPQNIIVERSAAQANYIGVASMDEYGNEKYPEGSLVWRAENLPKGAAAKEKGADNMLKIMSDARKAALDMRLIDPDASDNPKSKVNEAADRMVTTYHQWTADKGAQLVFIDLSTPKSAQGAEASRIRELIAKAEDGDSEAQEALDKLSPDELDALNAKFDVYNDLREKLIARGIPAEEIAFIHSANTDAQKEELFGKVRSGRVRFLFGSTAKMGAGMNVQERLVALHHLDAPWRPSDLEQREGRIIRQGNVLYDRDPAGFEIEINRYATKQTLDSRMWQTIEAKARFIEQVRKGATGGREVEDIAGEAANAAEMKAASSGNPLILEEMELRQKLRKMNNEESEHDRQQHRVRAGIRSITNGMEASERLLADTLADSKLVPASFAITINGKLIEKHKEAGAAILLAAAPYIMDMSARAEEVTVGEYGDFTIKVEKTTGDKEKFWLGLETARGSYQVGTFSLDADPTGMAIRMANTVKQLPEKAAEREAKIAAQKADLPKLEAQIKPWPKAADLAATKAQHAGIIEKLKPKKADPAQAAAPAKKDDDVNYSKDSGWYSPLTRTVEGIKQETALASQWRAMIEKAPGVKTDELEATGVIEYLKLKGGKVTKAEILSFLQDNGVQVRDVMKTTSSGAASDATVIAARHGFSVEEDYGDVVFVNADEEVVDFDDLPHAMQDELGRSSSGLVKYEQYTLPGGNNYRELLITLPNSVSEKIADLQRSRAAIEEPYQRRGEDLPESVMSEWLDINSKIRELQERRSGDYSTSHWDEKNILAHVRFDKRTDADGKRVLFINEIQSDWGQEGKKKGFRGEFPNNVLKAAINGGMTEQQARADIQHLLDAPIGTDERPTGDQWRRLGAATEGASLDLNEIFHDMRIGAPPSAPFVTKTDAWVSLAIKRMIRHAAENGFDRVAIINGEQASDLYWGNEAVAPAVARWAEVTKPQSIGELGNNILGREMASLMPLDHVDGGMLSVLKHDQVLRAVVEAIPVDVVNMLRAADISPDDLFGKKNVIAARLSVDSRRRAADGVLSALRLTHTAIGAKLRSLTPGGGDIELLPTLRASQLNTREVAGLLDPVRIFHGGASGSPHGATTAGAIAKPLSGKLGGSGSGEHSTAELARLLNSHASILGHDGLLTQGVEPPPSEGMRTFYDKIVPKVAGDVIKKLGGGKVVQVSMRAPMDGDMDFRIEANDDMLERGTFVILNNKGKPHPGIGRKPFNSREEAQSTLRDLAKPVSVQTGFDITPAMRDTALAGLPLFSVGKGKGSLTAASLEKQLRDGPAGTAIGKMLDDGKIVIHNTVPAGRDATAQGWTTKSDGPIHLVANRLTTGTVVPTLFHELFHRGMRQITGTASHKRLMKELEAVYKHYRSAPAGSATNKFWIEAMRRTDAANTTTADMVEEFGAYAVTAFESAPRSLRKWVAEFVGYVKAWLLRTRGIQFGGVTPGQMRAIAVHALRAETSGRAAPIPDDAASVNYSKAKTATVGDTYKLPPARTFITKIFDRFDRLNQVQKAVAEQGGSVTDLSDVYGQEEAYHSRAASAIDRFRRHRVGGLFKRMVKAGIAIEDVGLYLYAQHAPERNAQIAKLYQNGGQLNLTGMGNQNMQDGGSGMTNKEAADHMAEFQQRGIARKLDTFARELRDITKDSREILRNAGLETSAAIDAWEAAYQFYVPLSGKDEANNASSVIVGRGFDVRGGQKRAMGRKDMAKHVIEQIIIQHEQAVIRAEKNLVGKRLLQFVRDNPDDKLWQVNPVEQRRYIAADGQAEYRNQPLRTDRNVVSVRINGKDTFVLLADQGMADAIHNVGTEDVGFLLRALGVVSRFTSKMFTAFSPAFIAVNALRDFQTAMLHGYQVGGIKYSANIVKNIPGALAELVRDVRKGDSKLVKLYEQSGGRTGMVHMIKDFEEKHNEVMRQMAALKGVSLAEIMQAFEAGYKEGFQAVGRKARYNKFTGVFDALVESVETVNGVMENMTRLAAFKAAIDEGKSTKEAGSIAKNLTVNFNRKGELAPTLGSLYIFFNASVQGTVRMAEALKNPKLQAVAVGMVLLSAALAAMQMGDDDDRDEDGRPDFEQIPAYQRSRNLIFMHDDGSYTKIPLPLGWNVFHSFGTELAVMARSKSREAYGTGAWNILKGTVEMFNPVGTLMPSVAQPFAEIANNESHFGGPIYPEYKDKLPNSQQFYDGTEGSVYERATTMANEVTGGNEYRPGMVDVNPEKLQHVVEFFGGGALRFLTDTADAVTAAADGGPLQPVDKLPIARAFVGQLRDEYQTSRYYENVGKVEAIAAEIKGLEESGKFDEMAAVAEKNPMVDSLAAEIRRTKKALKQLKQHEREVRADEDLSEGELRQALQDIREERGQIVKPFNSMYEDAMRKGQ